jgi:magnesium transporter
MTIRRYELERDHFKMSHGAKEGCWIDVSRATPAELETLQAQYEVPKEFLKHALDPNERPRYQRSDGFTLFVIQASHSLTEKTLPYDIVPLAIIHTPENVITVCEHLHTVLLDLKTGRLRGMSPSEKNAFTLQIFMRVTQRYLQDVLLVAKKVEALEEQLEASTHNRELLSLMRLQKSLVYFKTALKANGVMFEKLQRDSRFTLASEDRELLADIQVENSQALEMTDIELSVIATMMGAFASVVSNNVNGVVRMLTLVTVFFAVPTWLVGVFGMNVPIPGQTRPWAFFGVMAISATIVIILLILFRRRKWL